MINRYLVALCTDSGLCHFESMPVIVAIGNQSNQLRFLLLLSVVVTIVVDGKDDDAELPAVTYKEISSQLNYSNFATDNGSSVGDYCLPIGY